MGRRKIISDEAVLAIAREMFIRDGASGSTRQIAARAGLSEAALFKRFTTKAWLFIAAMAPPPLDADAILAAARAAPDTRGGLIALGEGVLSWFRQALPVMIPLISNPLIGLEGVRTHFGRGGAETLVETARRYLAEEQQAGRCAGDPAVSALTLVACMHTIAQFEILGIHGGAVPPAGVRAMLDTLWTGLRPATPPP